MICLGRPGTCVCQNVDSLILVGLGPQLRVSNPTRNNAEGYSSYSGK